MPQTMRNANSQVTSKIAFLICGKGRKSHYKPQSKIKMQKVTEIKRLLPQLLLPKVETVATEVISDKTEDKVPLK